MTRRILALVVLGLGIAGSAVAGDFGTATEAKAMLDKTTAALKADKAGTLALITKGEGGFKDRDLYPFCGGPDGIYTAHGANPSLVGKSLKEIKDKNGKAVGEEIYLTAQEGKVTEVTYVWPRPGGSNEPVAKVSFVTKTGDQVCGVGYYK